MKSSVCKESFGSNVRHSGWTALTLIFLLLIFLVVPLHGSRVSANNDTDGSHVSANDDLRAEENTNRDDTDGSHVSAEDGLKVTESLSGGNTLAKN